MPEPVEEIIPAPADTVRTRLKIIPDCDWGGIKKIDLLIYRSDGIGSLEKHITADGSDEVLEVLLEAGTKDCIVIANSTQDLNLKIMERFDTMQTLTFSLKDEDTEHPVMVGRTALTAGADTSAVVTPFLCRIILEEVSNAMDGWVLMEEPEVYLSDVNPEVGILQEKDFRPYITQEEGPGATLPCDVGFYTQYPGIVLYCYPNDTPARVLGSRTLLTFFCKVEGEEFEETVALPPLGRNGVAHVKVIMYENREITIRI